MKNPLTPLLFSLALSGCGGVPDAVTEGSLQVVSSGDALDERGSSIVGGVPEGRMPWVVAVINAAGSGLLCSGTLLSDSVVLTAKHCVFHQDGNQKTPTPASALSIRVGSRVDDGFAKEVQISEVRTTEGAYTKAQILEGNDIALLLLRTKIPGITAPPYATTLPEKDRLATVAGYGLVSAQGTKFGEKNSGVTRIAGVDSRLVYTHGDAWTCSGDSGGPLLVDGIVVAVTSSGKGGCVKDATHIYTAVAPHRELIEEATAWEGACPEDRECPPSPSGNSAPFDAASPPGSEGCSATPPQRGGGGWGVVLVALGMLLGAVRASSKARG